MNLKQYLEKRSGSQTFYKIVNKDGKNQTLLSQIKINNKKDKAKLAENILQVIFNKQNKPINVFKSNDVWYIVGNKDYRMIDIVVLSLKRINGNKMFKNELKLSKKIKNENLNYLNKKIKPFISDLMKSGLVNGLILRGDLTVPDRFPNRLSDINIVVLTNFKHNNLKNKRFLIKALKGVSCRAYLCYYKFYQGGHFEGRTSILRNKKSRYTTEFSVISMPDFENAYNIWKKKGWHISKYDKHTFQYAKIIIQKEKFAKKFLDMFLSLK